MVKVIIIMKQINGCSVVVMNQTKYFHKCLAVLQNKQFTKLNHDSAVALENKEHIISI